jgi:3-oxoacyl-[acyl-carrier-protein] synthase-3
MLYIHGVGHFHPPTVITNVFLEGLEIGTTDHWIRERVGVVRRHTVLSLDYIAHTRNRDPRCADDASGYSNADTALEAARLALARASLSPSDIGLVIAGGSAPRLAAPAEALAIAAAIGVDAPAFDVNCACCTFVVQLHVVAMMNPACDFILLVQTENLTRAVNYEDRSTAVLMGDCTTAAVVSTRVPAPLAVARTFHANEPRSWRTVTIKSAGHLRQDGPAVHAFAIRRTLDVLRYMDSWPEACPHRRFIGHQANLRMLETVCRRADVPPSAHLFNVDRRGDCGAAGAPSVLSEHWMDLPALADVRLAVVGAGLTWAGALICSTRVGGHEQRTHLGTTLAV